MSHTAWRLTELHPTCDEHPWLKSSMHLLHLRAACAGPARLCALCHRTKPCMASWLIGRYLPLRGYANDHSCTRTSKYHTSGSHETAPNISRGCQLYPLSHTHTRARTRTHTRALLDSILISHLFKTPNTFAHIFADVCFHQPKQVGSWSNVASKWIFPDSESFPWGRRCSGQPQHPTPD